VIYVQVGNKYSFDQLQADHHYKLAGITLLAREQAKDYFCLATGIDVHAYGVGYWRTEGFYRRTFAKYGVQLDHLDPLAGRNHVVWYSNMAAETRRRMSREIYPGLPSEIERRIRRRADVVTRYFFRIRDQIAQCESDAPMMSSLCDAVVKRVCMPVWRFIGTKATRESSPTGGAPSPSDVR
jgi:hypothetical protein